ncbi:PH domain-containing protein [Actinocatenispora sera]|nr:PH domain-containing protein [Actinocatenispora sera]
MPGMAHPPNLADDLLGDGDSPPPSGRADIPPPIEPAGGYSDTDDFDTATGLPHDGPRRVTSVEPEPSAYVARYLFPTEKYRGEWRRHWIHIIVPIIVLIVATFLMGFVSSLLAHYKADIAVTVVVLLWVLSLIWVGWRAFDWFQDRFILTNKRVMLINGLITRKVAMMPLLRVTDMKYQQSPLGRMLNYGTFVLESAGQDQALREVPHLPNPNELYLRVVEEMYEPEAVEARLGESEADGSDA